MIMWSLPGRSLRDFQKPQGWGKRAQAKRSWSSLAGGCFLPPPLSLIQGGPAPSRPQAPLPHCQLPPGVAIAWPSLLHPGHTASTAEPQPPLSPHRQSVGDWPSPSRGAVGTAQATRPRGAIRQTRTGPVTCSNAGKKRANLPRSSWFKAARPRGVYLYLIGQSGHQS